MTTARADAKGRQRHSVFGLGRPFSRERGNFSWVYIWGAPLRAMHWIAALCIIVLIVTGYYIGRPYFMTTGAASDHFLMGWVRLAHFMAAAVIVMTGIVRVYWLFAGDKFERLPALFPVTPKNLRNLVRVLIAYVTLRPDKQPNFVGHNPLQQFSYTGVYLLATVMMVTGFTLYGQSNPGGLIFRAFAWVPPLLGGLQHVRLLHHALTWGFILFIMMHVYFVLRADYIERGGGVSSIITGGRYIANDKSYVDYDIRTVPAQPWPTEEHEALGKEP